MDVTSVFCRFTAASLQTAQRAQLTLQGGRKKRTPEKQYGYLLFWTTLYVPRANVARPAGTRNKTSKTNRCLVTMQTSH